MPSQKTGSKQKNPAPGWANPSQPINKKLENPAEFWPFWRWIIDPPTCSAFSLAHSLECWICQPRIFCICTCRPDCICAVWIVFVPASEPSICRMSVWGGDVRAGADLASRPGSTLQRHVLRPLWMRPGKCLLSSISSVDLLYFFWGVPFFKNPNQFFNFEKYPNW